MLRAKIKREDGKIDVWLIIVVLILLIIGAYIRNSFNNYEWQTNQINNNFTINTPGILEEKNVGISEEYKKFIESQRVFILERDNINVRVCQKLYTEKEPHYLSAVKDMVSGFTKNTENIRDLKVVDNSMIISGKHAFKMNASLEINNKPSYLVTIHIYNNLYVYEINIIYSKYNSNAKRAVNKIIDSIKII